ncbi:DUF6470 family protein [Halobacillus shinanisalinarum]|uniref:DUF6470 family protein n=1 Tax=Halobacillus shinanisalinarum TaxID=2932258 RepID=A0ABY4H2L3_9BACI|nr:DUF6470 family protein [Halobacillus shinanisalinarum]UOQ94398.1 DUF6470 family protein [Halobacillus shinanisalinarum]
MSISKVQIHTTEARIGINVQTGKQTIRQHKVEQSIQQPKADMTIRQRPGKLTIDQTKAWHNLDLKNVLVRTEELVGEARQIWLEGIARVSREGDELMRIEDGGNPIAAHAKQNAGFEFTMQPGGRPVYDLVDFNYVPGEAEISVDPQDPIIKAQPREPEISYQSGNVDIYMKQYGDIQIDWKV